MTVIAGIRAHGGVYMAADSAVCADGYRYEPTRKISRRTLRPLDDEFLIGAAGDLRIQSVVRHRLDVAPPSSDDDLDLWAYDIACDLTALLVDMKPPVTTDSGAVDAEILLAFRGRLWQIGSQLAEPIDRYATCGSGQHHALGALTALEASGHLDRIDPVEALAIACGAAVKWDARCAAPIQIEALHGPLA